MSYWNWTWLSYVTVRGSFLNTILWSWVWFWFQWSQGQNILWFNWKQKQATILTLVPANRIKLDVKQRRYMFETGINSKLYFPPSVRLKSSHWIFSSFNSNLRYYWPKFRPHSLPDSPGTSRGLSFSTALHWFPWSSTGQICPMTCMWVLQGRVQAAICTPHSPNAKAAAFGVNCTGTNCWPNTEWHQRG